MPFRDAVTIVKITRVIETKRELTANCGLRLKRHRDGEMATVMGQMLRNRYERGFPQTGESIDDREGRKRESR